ncbi:hypothetical protein SAMN04487905_10611 [Actinopolyspora xinjiangensis]|uniref:Acb2/Tad1 hairpin domain-containing protein n=1 Tax=Actinopolyspora xinjiangensis TaxID=405564 RepID=A0A1H0U3A7_9ACTN|nr:hypothetical protein [Actinopolyspora xinjiangensis]SDP60485.1 hypothetical protein SAMN04487905_10611 [Actinopolyspora xinjiangensis]
MQSDDIESRFTYHAPTDDRIEQHEQVRAEVRELAHRLNDTLPEGREKSVVMTKLEEALMWANAAIARQPE